MIGIFGGSFDPIHNGHLRAAVEICEHLQLQQIRFVPCHIHAFAKSFQASSMQRTKMLEIALKNQPFFVVDDRETKLEKISYMIDTLTSLREECGKEKLSLILGVDTFLQLPKWHRWQEFLDYASIIVAQRPGYQLPTDSPLHEYLHANICIDKDIFLTEEKHSIFLLGIPLLEISSTYIREQIKASKSVEYLLPKTVIDLITKENIYQASSV